jgi:hypothetical protein
MRWTGIAASGPVVLAAATVVAAGCGDNLAAPVAPDAGMPGSIDVVGHADLGARGMNSALAIAGTTIYVGSRIDQQPILIVDASDPTAPRVVGELGAPEQGLGGMSARELRAVADLNLLVVLNIQCSPDLHGCGGPVAEAENLKLYDITDRLAPVHRATYEITGSFARPRGPHEFFLWRDPAAPARVLLFVAVPGAANGYEVVDVSDPAAPVRVVQWDPRTNAGLPSTGSDNILHSVAATPDGRTLWMAHQQGGLVAVDQGDIVDGVTPPVLTMLTPPANALLWPPSGTVGPHSAVPVPGRDLLVVTEEIYPPPFGTGCPWGHMRVVSADPTAPAILGELTVPENDPAYCAANDTTRITFTSHNVTTTPHLALLTWYSAGFIVADLAQPSAPAILAQFLPEPLASVTTEDPGLGGHPILMWTYPVIVDGLIYVVDIRNGLYVLRYRGPYQQEVSGTAFAEGNSNLE